MSFQDLYGGGNPWGVPMAPSGGGNDTMGQGIASLLARGRSAVGSLLPPSPMSSWSTPANAAPAPQAPAPMPPPAPAMAPPPGPPPMQQAFTPPMPQPRPQMPPNPGVGKEMPPLGLLCEPSAAQLPGP